MPSPDVDVSGHGIPLKVGRNASVGGSNARMTEGVNMFENWFVEGTWDERTKHRSGNISKERKSWRKRNGSVG
jgi:hypothetical protein